MEKISTKKIKRGNIPYISKTFPKYNPNKKIGWFLITVEKNFLDDYPNFYQNFVQIKNPYEKNIYFMKKNIDSIIYNIVYIGEMKQVYKNKFKMILVFFLTVTENDLVNRNLTRKFRKIFNLIKIEGSKKLNQNNEYNINSYVFHTEFANKTPERYNLFLYFKNNIKFSSIIRNELKNQIDSDLRYFVDWNTNFDLEGRKNAHDIGTEIHEHLKKMKILKDKHLLAKKWYIQFILLFKKFGAEYYSKNNKKMFKNQTKESIISDLKINDVKIKELDNEILVSEKMGNINVFFSKYIVKKNKKITHIYMDGSSIDKKHCCLIIMALEEDKYKCLFFMKYKKNKNIIKNHLNKCSRKIQKKNTGSDICKCEWLAILDFIFLKLKFVNSITIDFEHSLVSAANEKKLKIFGCYFHYEQNLYKRTKDYNITNILAHICDLLPFCTNKTQNHNISILKNICENENTKKHTNNFYDYEMIKYLENIFCIPKINKFNYDVKNKHDYFKLTNNCCERFFKYLKDLLNENYTFKQSISARVYLDLVGFYITKESGLVVKYQNAENALAELVKRYGKKIKYGDFKANKKKKKMDKNFDKSLKKKNISKPKKNIIIESESEFSESFISEKKTTRSLKYLKQISDNNKDYSEKYKNKKFRYIKNGLKSNIDLEIKVEQQEWKIKSLELELKNIKKTLKKLKKE